MALQGTIDTFELTEVIRMLATGEKTGRLGLSGDRGSGSLWFTDGRLAASETDTSALAADHAAVLFQLLRFEEGSFVFDQGVAVDTDGEPVDTEPVLEEAGQRLEEWSEIEAVVPTLRHQVGLRTELSRSDVVIDQRRWTAVAAIAGGLSVGDLGDALEQDELDVSRTVKSLVELGLVEVDEPLVEPEAPDVVVSDHAEGTERAPEASVPDDRHEVGEPAEADQPQPAEENGFDPGWIGEAAAEPEVGDPSARHQLDELASGFGLTDEPLGSDPMTVEGPPPVKEIVEIVEVDEPLEFTDPAPLPGAVAGEAGSFPIEEAEAAGEATTPLFAHDTDAPDAPDAPNPAPPAPGEAAEVARQLANLSPEAARAVAAAARATTDEEREAALALVAEDGDQPLDPDLLRSFLSSVRH